MTAPGDAARPESAPRTEDVPLCPLCGHDRASPFLEGPDRSHGVPGHFTYRRCHACGTVFQSPRVRDADLHLLYPGDYYTKGGDPADAAPPPRSMAGWRDRLRAAVQRGVRHSGDASAVDRVLARSRSLRERAFFDRLLDEMLPSGPRPGRALDVGCGAGHLLMRLAEVDWEVEGSEWDPETAALARRRTGAIIHVGGIEDLDAGIGRFDLVVLRHVFEHLARPVAALRRIGEFLTPAGRTVLVYPNPASLGARRWGEFHFPWEIPRHLVLPPTSALVQHVGRAGLRVESVRTTGRFAALWSSYSRRQRRGESVRFDRPPEVFPGDRVLASAERALVGAGLHVGEEIVVVLRAERA